MRLGEVSSYVPSARAEQHALEFPRRVHLMVPLDEADRVVELV